RRRAAATRAAPPPSRRRSWAQAFPAISASSVVKNPGFYGLGRNGALCEKCGAKPGAMQPRRSWTSATPGTTDAPAGVVRRGAAPPAAKKSPARGGARCFVGRKRQSLVQRPLLPVLVVLVDQQRLRALGDHAALD